MEGLLYPIIGLAVVGGLYWVLTEMTRRQQRVDASLKKLEELAAEVTMEAGAVLEQADERIALLRELLEAVELKAQERQQAGGQAPERAEEPAPDGAPAPAETLAGETGAAPFPTPVPAEQSRQPAGQAHSSSPSSLERYQAIRSEVWALADQGLTAADIAQKVGIPRGEVQLMLNLRSRRATV